MGLALDEPKPNDERIEVEGFSFILASDVADMVRSHGNLHIDYADRLWMKGFQLSLPRKSAC
jgi:hypothetical protein